MDIVAAPTGTGSHAVWATYGPRGRETGSGLLVLEATWNGSAVDFTFIDKVPFLATHTGGTVGRLTYVASEATLYASYSCAGVAKYSVSSPLAPVEVGRYEFVPLAGEFNNPSSLQVIPAKSPYLLVSLFGSGVGILDGGAMSQGWKLGSPFDTGFQPNAFLGAPEAAGFADGTAFWVAEGAGGLNRIQFKVFP